LKKVFTGETLQDQSSNFGSRFSRIALIDSLRSADISIAAFHVAM
jgi:hypothetical protein